MRDTRDREVVRVEGARETRGQICGGARDPRVLKGRETSPTSRLGCARLPPVCALAVRATSPILWGKFPWQARLATLLPAPTLLLGESLRGGGPTP